MYHVTKHFVSQAYTHDKTFVGVVGPSRGVLLSLMGVMLVGVSTGAALFRLTTLLQTPYILM